MKKIRITVSEKGANKNNTNITIDKTGETIIASPDVNYQIYINDILLTTKNASFVKTKGHVLIKDANGHIIIDLDYGSSVDTSSFEMHNADGWCSLSPIDTGDNATSANSGTGSGETTASAAPLAIEPTNSTLHDAAPDAGLSTGSKILAGIALLGGGIGAAVFSGGGHSSDASPAPAPAPYAISGSFTAGPVVAGNDLKAVAFDKDGKVIGESFLAADGSFNITIANGYTGTVLIQVQNTGSNKDYFDEASDQQVNMTTDSLCAVTTATGANLVVYVTALTDMAMHKLNNWQTASSNDINANNKAISVFFGLGDSDITGQKPTPVVTADGGDNLANANDYGKVLAALSALETATGQSTETIISKINAAIADGSVKTILPDMIKAADLLGQMYPSIEPIDILSNITASKMLADPPSLSEAIAGDNVVNASEEKTIIKGTAEVDAAVSLVIGGVTRVAVIDNGAWSYTLTQEDIDNLGQGSHTFAIYQEKSSGVDSKVMYVNVTVDTVKPVTPNAVMTHDTGTSASDGVTSDASITAPTNIEDGAGVEYQVDGGQWSANYTAPTSDGQHTVLIRQIDKAGNVSQSQNVSFTLDTIAPAAAAVSEHGTTKLADNMLNSTESSSNATLRVSLPTSGSLATAGDSVELLLGGSSFATAKHVTLAASDITNGYVEFAVSKADLGADGFKSITAKVTDAAGHATEGNALSFTLDSTVTAAPTGTHTMAISDDSGATGDRITNDSAVKIALTLGSSLTLAADEHLQVSADGGSTWVNATGSGTSWATGDNAVTLHSGASKAITARIVDTAGNTSALTLSNNDYTLDSTVTAAPTGTHTVAISDDSGAAGDRITSDSAVKVALTLGSSLTLAADEHLQVSADGGSTWVNATGSGTSWATGDNAVTLQSGAGATITARIVDTAGNASTVSLTNNNYTLDTTASAAATVAEQVTTKLADGFLNAAEAGMATTIRATLPTSGLLAAAGDSIELLLDGASFATAKTTTLKVTDISHGYVDFSVSKADLGAEGAKALTVKLTDVAGNATTGSALSFTLDTAKPATPNANLTTDSTNGGAGFNSDNITNSGAITVPTNIENGAVVEYRVQKDSGSFSDWSSTYSAPATNGTADGAYAVEIRQTDKAGNISASQNISFTLDSTKPDTPDAALTTDSTNGLAGFGTDHVTNSGAITAPVNVENGAVVEYSVSKDSAAFSAWSTSYSAPATDGTADGHYMVLIRQTDKAGNISQSQGIVFTLDSTKPATPDAALTTDSTNGGSGFDSDHVTNSGAITAPINTENGAVLEYRVNKGSAGFGDWSTSYTAPVTDGTADGAYAVEIRQTDKAGNISASQSIGFTLDSTKPDTPDAALTTDSTNGGTGFDSDNITNSGAITVPTNTENGALVEYRINKGSAGFGDWSTSYSAPVTDGTADGAYAVEIRQTDKAGNISASQSISFTLDSTKPDTPNAALATDSTNGGSGFDSDHVTNSGAITAPTNTENGALVEYRINKGSAGFGDWSTSYTAPVTDGTADGAYTVEIRQTDKAGNISASQSIGFTLDSTKPDTPDAALTTDSTNGGSGFDSDHVTNSGAITAPTNTENGAVLEYRINKGSAGFGDWSTSYTAPVTDGTADGAYTVEIRQTDKAGNISASQSIGFTLDSTKPDTPDAALTTDSTNGGTGFGSDHVTNSGAITVPTNTENGALLEYRINKDSAGFGDWSTSYTAPVTDGTADGAYTVEIRQTDKAGNISASQSISFTLDSTKPDTPDAALTTDSTNGGSGFDSDNITNSGAITAPTNTENGAVLEYRINKDSAGFGDWSTSYTAPVTDGTADGAYAVEIRQTDKAGNISASQSISFTLDSTKPDTPNAALATDSTNGGSGFDSDHVTNSGAITVPTNTETGAVLEYRINKDRRRVWRLEHELHRARDRWHS